MSFLKEMSDISDEAIKSRIFDLLKNPSGLSLSPRELRDKLSEEFGTDMSLKKDLVKESISSFINQIEKIPKKPITKKSTPKNSKVLVLSPELADFCSPNEITNLAQVRSCILQYADSKGLKDKADIVFDEALSKVFPITSLKKKRITIFQIYKFLKNDKAYKYWSYSN